VVAEPDRAWLADAEHQEDTGDVASADGYGDHKGVVIADLEARGHIRRIRGRARGSAQNCSRGLKGVRPSPVDETIKLK
jgi:hypothetical protein